VTKRVCLASWTCYKEYLCSVVWVHRDCPQRGCGWDPQPSASYEYICLRAHTLNECTG